MCICVCICVCVYIYIYIQTVAACLKAGLEVHLGANHQEGIRNRIEPAEPNRTEPDRATQRPKSTGRTVSNRETYLSEPNRTEPNR